MSDFHFIRPLWLLAIFAVFVGLILLKRYRVSQSGWQQFLPKHLANVLLEGNQDSTHSLSKSSKGLLVPFIIGLLTVIALAGPTWEKLPQPVYQTERGSVIIMDMSYSMYATDLSPNRLTRSKYKTSDLLEQLVDGDVGLIAYAGDAFVISPLTEDVNNIELLLPALSPEIMPELGSNPITALILADEMLKNSGHLEGNIYWLTDGIDSEDIQDITEWKRKSAHHLNILGVGTANGAPIKLSNGELFKDNSGAIVIPKLTINYLDGIASRSGGQYETITNDNSDVISLIKSATDNKQASDKESKNLEQGDQWHDMGAYLILLILPFVLGYFRRGLALGILPLCLFFVPVENASASAWTDLWKTKDQQAKALFDQENYAEAAETFKNNNWKGSAYYKAKEFDKALEAFSKDQSAGGFYNQGNTLAQLQKIDEAIAAYEKALELNPDYEDAKINKKTLEDLKKQQEQQQQQQGDGEQDQENQDQQQGDQSEGEQQENQEGQQGDQSKSDQQDGSDQDAQQNQSEQNEQNADDNEQAPSDDTSQEQGEEQENESEEEQSAQQDNQDGGEAGDEQQAQALSASEQEKLDQELDEKHMQILNKVTDDPYLLLRNKMQLEYQKRRQQGYRSGVNKQW